MMAPAMAPPPYVHGMAPMTPVAPVAPGVVPVPTVYPAAVPPGVPPPMYPGAMPPYGSFRRVSARSHSNRPCTRILNDNYQSFVELLIKVVDSDLNWRGRSWTVEFAEVVSCRRASDMLH